MKIAVAQIKTDPGSFDTNMEKILLHIEEGFDSKADLVVFPELTIPGYASMDLFLKENYLVKNISCIRQIIDKTKDLYEKYDRSISVIVGAVTRKYKNSNDPFSPYKQFNSAIVIKDGKVISQQDKTLLPSYDIFFEERYFDSSDLLRTFSLNGKNIGLHICEDMWDSGYSRKPVDELGESGVDIFINISASPFYINKYSQRLNIIRKFVNKYKIPFLYVNAVGGQDGYDGEVIFEGRSIYVDDSGKVRKVGKAFEEDFFIIDTDNDKKNSAIYLKSNEVKEMHDSIVCGIKDYFRRNGFSKAIIGLSGGIDSAVVAALTAKAIGGENIIGVTMPSQYSSKGSIDDSRELAENLGIKQFSSIPISEVHKKIRGEWQPKINLLTGINAYYGVTDENIQARLRGLCLMSIANATGAMLVTTGNKTEMALGYCTLYGDMNGGLGPIGDVNKMNVYKLAKFINIEKVIIPINTISKPPSAELSPDQTDEAGLGGEYSVISPLVDELVDGNYSYEDLVSKYPKEIVDKCLRRFRISEFKRRQAPPAIKICQKTFGIGRRIPMAHNFSL